MRVADKGEIVLVDCGYNGISDMKRAKVLDAFMTNPLFPNDKPSWTYRVQVLSTDEVFNAHTIERLPCE